MSSKSNSLYFQHFYQGKRNKKLEQLLQKKQKLQHCDPELFGNGLLLRRKSKLLKRWRPYRNVIGGVGLATLLMTGLCCVFQLFWPAAICFGTGMGLISFAHIILGRTGEARTAKLLNNHCRPIAQLKSREPSKTVIFRQQPKTRQFIDRTFTQSNETSRLRVR